MVPFYQRYQSELFNKYLTDQIRIANNATFEVGNSIPGKWFLSGVEDFPDGTFLIRNANTSKVDLKLQVNDMIFNEYHSNNGITKVHLRLPTDSILAKKSSEGPQETRSWAVDEYNQATYDN